MSIRTPLTKRRWLQFSLRTLLLAVTLAALGLGWWKHREYCLTRAEYHERLEMICVLRGQIVFSQGSRNRGLSDLYSSNSWEAEHKKCQTQAQRHQDISRNFRQAVWRPWLRWSIDEPPIEVESHQPFSQ